MGLHEFRRQAVALTPEDQHVIRAKRRLTNRRAGASREEAQPLLERSSPLLRGEMCEAGAQVRVHGQIDEVPVVEACAPHPALVQAEPEGLDEVQASAEGRGQAADRARVLGDLGVDEDDVHRVRVAARDPPGARCEGEPAFVRSAGAPYPAPMEISLNGHEARVLGVLIEKAFTTPDQYPLSLNGATNGCNQKSNREPVLDFSEAEVRVALQGLRMKGLVGVSVPSGSRVEKYRHNSRESLKLGDRALAALAELLLRGPQTSGELRTRAKRMRDVSAPDVLEEALGALEEHGFAKPLPGGRATRWAQMICPELHPDGAQPAPESPVPAAAPASAPDRLEELERRVEGLERTVQHLTAALGLDEEAAR